MINIPYVKKDRLKLGDSTLCFFVKMVDWGSLLKKKCVAKSLIPTIDPTKKVLVESKLTVRLKKKS